MWPPKGNKSKEPPPSTSSQPFPVQPSAKSESQPHDSPPSYSEFIASSSSPIIIGPDYVFPHSTAIGIGSTTTATASTHHPNPAGHLPSQPHPFMPIPATRHDTISSYVGGAPTLNLLPNGVPVAYFPPDGSGTFSPRLSAAPPGPTDRPFFTQCPFCRTVVTTVIVSTPGLITYLSCLGALFLGCWFGCCLIPFCCSKLQDVQHFCPKCNNSIAIYKRI